MLRIPSTPIKEEPDTEVMFHDPSPTTECRQALAKHPGLQEVLRCAARLADATRAIVAPLKRYELSTEHADDLLASLKDRPDVPSVADHDTAWRLQRQIEAIGKRIWDGEGNLSPDEDLSEREDFWQNKLSGIHTREVHDRLEVAVERLLSEPRSPDRELALLNAFAAERQREPLLLGLGQIRMATGTDCLSVCYRWRDLVEIGSRFFSHRQVASGDEAVSFHDLVVSRQLYPAADSSLPLELEWAQSLRETTESLRLLAEFAGFSAGDRVPISRMVQEIVDILDGKATDLRSSIAAVQLLVDEIIAQAKRSRSSALDRLHQLVLELKGGVTRILTLVQQENHRSTSHALAVLDYYVMGGKADGPWPGRCGWNNIEWRTLADSLGARAREATVLWNQELGDPPRRIGHDFVSVSTTHPQIAMIDQENSFHGLVLTVARVVLNPERRGWVPQNAIDDLGPGPGGKPYPRVVRIRLVREMLRSKWPAETTRELEREHVAALDRMQTWRLRPPTEGNHLPNDPPSPKVLPPSTAQEPWKPSAHQQLVLDLLKREGRLRAGTLWERISPKHIDRRAHQNAMRELVARRMVEKSGKGRATEYWLP